MKPRSLIYLFTCFLFVGTLLFYTPFLLNSWQKQLAHSFLKSLGGEWRVDYVEDIPGTLVFYRPQWSPPSLFQNENSFHAAAEKISINYSVSWTTWRIFLEIDVEHLSLQLLDSSDPIHKLLPPAKKAPFFLRPEIRLSINEGKLELSSQNPILFQVNAMYGADWNASVKLLDFRNQLDKTAELDIQRNQEGVKELILSCHKCSLAILERLGREVGLWWEPSLAHSGILDGKFRILWDRKGPLQADGALHLSHFLLSSPWDDRSKISFPNIDLHVLPSTQLEHIAEIAITANPQEKLTGEIASRRFSWQQLSGQLALLRNSPRLKWVVYGKGEMGDLATEGELLWKYNEDTIYVKAFASSSQGPQILVEIDDEKIVMDVSEAKEEEWAFFQPFLLQGLNISPHYALVLENGIWSSRFEQKSPKKGKRLPFTLNLDISAAAMILKDADIALENVSAQLNTSGMIGAPLTSITGEGYLQWESGLGAGLKHLGPLKNGAIQLRKKGDPLDAIGVDIQGEEWNIAGSSGKLHYSATPKLLKKLLPDVISDQISTNNSLNCNGIISITSDQTHCHMETNLELPSRMGLDPIIFKGELNWEFTPSPKNLYTPTFGPWQLISNQFSLPVDQRMTPLRLSFASIPLEIRAEGEIQATHDGIGWHLDYLLRDVTASHPLVELRLPLITYNKFDSSQSRTSHHTIHDSVSYLSLPLRHATLTLKDSNLDFIDVNASLFLESGIWLLKDFEANCCSMQMSGNLSFMPKTDVLPPKLLAQISTLVGDLEEIRPLLAKYDFLKHWIPSNLSGRLNSDKDGLNIEMAFSPGDFHSKVTFNGAIENGSWESHEWKLNGLSSDISYNSDADKVSLANLQTYFSHHDLSEPLIIAMDIFDVPLRSTVEGVAEVSLLKKDETLIYQSRGTTSFNDNCLNLALAPFERLTIDKNGIHSCTAQIKKDILSSELFSFSSLPILKKIIRPFPIRTDFKINYSRSSDLIEMDFKAPMAMKITRQGDLWKLSDATYKNYTCSAEWTKHRHTVKLNYGEIASPNQLHMIGSGFLTLGDPQFSITLQRFVLNPFAFGGTLCDSLSPFFQKEILQNCQLNLPGTFTLHSENGLLSAAFHLSNSIQAFSGELLLNPSTYQCEAKGSATLAAGLDWNWKASFNKLIHLHLMPAREKRSLDIAFEHVQEKGWKMASIQGRLVPFDLNLHASHESPDYTSWQGEVKVISALDHPLLPENWKQLVHTLGIGKGWIISGEWGSKGFYGYFNGRNCRLMDQRFAVCHAKVVSTSPDLVLKQVHLSDGATDLEIEDMRLIALNNSWKVEIPHLLAKKIRFKNLANFSPFFSHFSQSGHFKLLELHQVEGLVGNLESWSACGKCNFQLSGGSFLRQTLLQPALLPGLSNAWESSLLIPVTGTIEFEIHTGKLLVRELKEVYSQGKLSKFTLAPRALPSFISSNGDVAFYVKIKREGLLRRSETLLLDVEGNISSPTLHMRRQAVEEP